MPKQIKAIICPKCKGNGTSSSGEICDNCRGIGFIGSDGLNEYYLSSTPDGKLKVVDIKKQNRNYPETNNHHHSFQKKSIMKDLYFIFIILSYIVFLAIYFTTIKEQKIFYLVTIIFLGLITIVFIYNTKSLNIIVNNLINLIFKDTEDYLHALDKIKKNTEKENRNIY